MPRRPPFDKTRFFISFLILTFIFTGSCLPALKAQNRTLTLEEAIWMLRSGNSVQKQYEYALEAAQEGIQLQKADYLPTLQLQTSVSHANEAPRIPVEFGNDTVLARQGTKDTFISRFQLSQMIYDFGKTKNNVTAARYQEQSVSAEFDRKESDLISEVRRQFYLSLYYQQLDSMYSEVIPYSEELAEINRQRLNNGVALSTDVLQAQVELQNMQAQQAAAQSNYRKTLLQVAYLTGQQDTDFDTEGKLPLIPEQNDLLTFYPSLYNQAIQNRRDIDQLKYQSKQQQALARSVDALKYPTLMLQSDFSYFGPDAFGYYSGLSSRGLDPFNWRVGIGFTITLFDGSRIRHQKNQYLALEQQYGEQANQLEQQFGTEIQTQLKDLETLRILEQSNKRLLEQINANIVMVEASYKNGNIPRLEYIKAIIPRASAEAALQKTRSDIAQALVQLGSTVGTDVSTLWEENNGKE